MVLRFRRRALIAAVVLSLAAFADVVAGCSSDDSASPSSPTSDAAVDAIVSDGDLLTTDSGDRPPPGCIEFLPTDPSSYRTGAAPDPERYSSSPDLQANVSVGDSALPDAFRIRLDAKISVGTTTLSTKLVGPYVYASSGVLAVDFTANDGGGSYAHMLYATSGTVNVTSMTTPWQTEATATDVRFDEGSVEGDTFTIKTGGACYWIRSLTWNTKLESGCAPFQASDPCGAGKMCMPTNANGGDGLCVAIGSQNKGDSCTYDDRADASADAGVHVKWDSSCGAGLRCFQDEELDETEPHCRQLCDVTAATSGCPAGTHCGGGYDICIPDAVFTKVGSGDLIDPALVGQACAVDVTTALSNDVYCGGGNNQTGFCFPVDAFADGGHSAPVCNPFVKALSDCAAPTIGSYSTYKSGDDSSDISCIRW